MQPTPVTVVVVNNNNNNNNNNNLLSGSRGGNASGVYNGTRRAGDMTRGSMQRGPLGSGVANGTTQSFTADPRDTSSVSWQELRVMRMPAAGAAGSAAARADAAANATVGARPAISAPGLTIAFAPAAAEAGPAPSPAAAEPAVPPPARAPVLGGGGLITSRLPEARAAAAPAGASAADAAASRPIAGTLAAGAQGSPEARVLSQQGPADRTSQPGSGLGSSIGLRDGIPAASFQLGSGASQVLGRINSQLQRPAPDFGLLGLGRGAGAAYAGSDDSGTGLDSGEGAVGGKDGGELVAPAAAESAAAALARPVRVQVMRPKTNTPEQDTTMYVIRMEGKEGA